mgnify:CR=1 FL=1
MSVPEGRAGQGERYAEVIVDGEVQQATIGESSVGSDESPWTRWQAENLAGYGPKTTEGRPGAPGYEPYRIEMSAGRIEAAERLLGRIPTAEDLIALERAGIAGQMSQAHQNLVSNAAQRGLVHSGILRAQQQKLTGQGFGQMQAAAAKAQAFPEQARAQILASLASGKPLPEVTYEQQPSGIIPLMMGGAGAIIGGITTGSPQGAMAGYGVGQAAGTVIEGGPTYHTAGRSRSSFG